MFKVLCFYQRVHNFLLCRPTIFKLDHKKRLPHPSGPLSTIIDTTSYGYSIYTTIVSASTVKQSSGLLNSILQERTSPIAVSHIAL